MTPLAFDLFDFPAPLDMDDPTGGERGRKTGPGRLAEISRTLASPMLKFSCDNPICYNNFSKISSFSRVSEPQSSLSPAPRSVVTPELLRRWRVSRPWLKAREERLLAMGWNKTGLYRIKRPLGRSYTWGVAWSMWWAEPNVTPALMSTGEINFRVSEHDGRVNTLVARPR